MLGVFNGVFKDNEITVDVVQIDPASVLDSSHYNTIKNDYGVFVSFDFKPDFFYFVPVFGFYCDTYKRVELIELAC